MENDNDMEKNNKENNPRKGSIPSDEENSV